MDNNQHGRNFKDNTAPTAYPDYPSREYMVENLSARRRRKTNNVLTVVTIVLAIIFISIATFALLNDKNSQPEKSGNSSKNTGELTEEDFSVNELQKETVEETIEENALKTENPVKTMYVNCSDFLALKSGPGINYKRILKIPAGESVELLEDIQSDFVKVRYNGNVGYVAASYLSDYKPSLNTVVKTMYVNCSDFLALKSGPGINYKRILKIPAGESVELLEDIQSDFVKVRYNGNVGYVAASYLAE